MRFVFLLAPLLYASSGLHAQSKPVVPVMPDEWRTEIHGKMAADAKARADQIQIVFVGDSITARWTSSPGEALWKKKYAPLGAINLGISSDGTQNVLWRLQNGVLDPLHPKMVILLIGTNNLSSPPDAVAYGIWTIVACIRKKLPDARVLVQGIFPREDKPEYNARIAQVNALIARLDDGKMVKYVYFGDKFLKPDGLLDPEVFTDKVHPNVPEGFRIWDEQIYPIVQQWLKLSPIADTSPPRCPVPVPADLGPATATARNDWLFRHNRILATPAAYKAKCRLLFLGDQVTQAWDRAPALFKKEYGRYTPLNFAIFGNRPENMLWQAGSGALDGLHPKLVVMQSQSFFHSPTAAEELAAGVEATARLLLKKLPESKVLMIGGFPLGEKPTDAIRAKISAYNARLAQVADNQRLFFLDIGKAFLKPDGTLEKGAVPSLQPYTEKSFAVWADAQRATIAQLMAP
jgi:lysophospholipase L1-like esterase